MLASPCTPLSLCFGGVIGVLNLCECVRWGRVWHALGDSLCMVLNLTHAECCVALKQYARGPGPGTINSEPTKVLAS